MIFLKKHMTAPHSQMESDKEQIMVVSFPEKFSRNDEGGEGSISKKLSTFWTTGGRQQGIQSPDINSSDISFRGH